MLESSLSICGIPGISIIVQDGLQAGVGIEVGLFIAHHFLLLIHIKVVLEIA